MPRPIEIRNNNSQITSIFKAISNMRRLQILNELSDGCKKLVSKLGKVVPDLSQSALFRQLGRLRRAYIVKTSHESQSIFYTVRSAEALKILKLFTK
tara:strand:+ start:188 stop:478 length:291 start_codon:yes stop_codon:yes gene_type:complete